MELLRRLSRDVSTYFKVTDVNRTHSTVNAEADIRALVMDLKDGKVHTFVAGRKIKRVDSKKDPTKGKGAVDVLTEGKEVLENGLFRNWKDRTGKLGADIFGCDPECQRQQGVVVGEDGLDGGVDVDGDRDDDDETPMEFDALVNAEIENEA